jgi:hypothetical protein
MGGACSGYGEGRDVYRGSMGIREGKRPLGRSRGRWEENIEADLQEGEWGGMDCGFSWLRIGILDDVWDRGRWRAIVNSVMNLRVP